MSQPYHGDDVGIAWWNGIGRFWIRPTCEFNGIRGSIGIGVLVVRVGARENLIVVQDRVTIAIGGAGISSELVFFIVGETVAV